jgi:hypothetical protein
MPRWSSSHIGEAGSDLEACEATAEDLRAIDDSPNRLSKLLSRFIVVPGAVPGPRSASAYVPTDAMLELISSIELATSPIFSVRVSELVVNAALSDSMAQIASVDTSIAVSRDVTFSAIPLSCGRCPG